MRGRGSTPGRKPSAGLKAALAVWIVLLTAALAYPQVEIGEPIPFKISGRDYRVAVRAVSGGSSVFLQDAGLQKELSLGGGEDIFPVVKTLEDHFFVLWIHHQKEMMGFGFYDSRVASSRVLSAPGFSFLSKPTLVLQSGEPIGIIFLGNASDNDDIYFLGLWDGCLVNVSRTRVSEKKFSVEPDSDGVLVSALTLHERVLYHLDLPALVVSIRERRTLRTQGSAGNWFEGTLETDPRVLENTYLAFGDSITWGKMRMNNLEGEYHPELAFPEKIKSRLASFYGPAYPVNLGVSGDSTYSAVLRVDTDLAANPGLYFLLMLGTNDCIDNEFSIDSVMENLETIISKAEAKLLRVIISTIPPRKDFLGGLAYVKENIAVLNARIAEMAVRRKIGFVDTHGAFMNTNPPDGWKALLEDVGGNHPSPDGHLVIAALFADSLAAFPPRLPSGVLPLPTSKSNQRAFVWQPCYESDFSFFRVEYGYEPDKMVFTATTPWAYFLYTILPFQVNIRLPLAVKLYFRIQTVDTAGHASPFFKFQTS